MSTILADISVIDMTEGVAGPYATMLLADMGAAVVKVERPDGDWSRPSPSDGGGTAGKAADLEANAQFMALNRNKRNLGLDAATPDGRRIIERLVARADVIVSNYRPGVMARLGLDYDRCCALRPGLIYCAISGFGQDGPQAQVPASDTIIQAMSGVMSLVGEPDGPPLRVGFPLIDMTAANHATQAILLALYGRLAGTSRVAKGQADKNRANAGETVGPAGTRIEISLLGAALGLMCGTVSRHLVSGGTWLPARQGNQNPLLAPAGAFATSDGRFISVAVLRDSHWRKFCAAMGLAHLEHDPRFRTNEQRLANRPALDAIIAPILAAEPAAVWLERLRAADILCGPINTFADITSDPTLAALVPSVPSGLAPATGGAARPIMGTPIKFDGGYFGTRRPAPSAGEHTAEILAELDFSAEDIAQFLLAGSAFTSRP